MDKQKVRDRIIEIGIVPVVRASSAGEARVAADAVCQGGIPVVEITMTVPGAVDVIRELVKNCSCDVLIGAGTVLNPEAARRCLDAGAQFLVSPGLNLKTVELAVREGKLIMAGALTPTEVITAWEAGADFVKIFPCGQVGGEVHQGAEGPAPTNSACSDRWRQSKHRGCIYRSASSRAGHRSSSCAILPERGR